MQAVITNRPIRKKFKSPSGRKQGEKNKLAFSAYRPIAYDFLKQRFAPLSFNMGRNRLNWKQIEKTFFTSVRHFSNLYKIEFMEDTSLPFPMNIAAAVRSLRKKLEVIDPSLHLVIAENREKTTLAIVKQLTKEYDIYYVPLNALDELHRDHNKICFQLLLSIFAYLNRHAGLPLLCENDYLTSCYEAITEWVNNADNELDGNEYNSNCAELKATLKKIKILEKAVLDPSHLLEFKCRLQFFKPRTHTEKRLKTVARKFYSLYQRYPNRSFHENIHHELLEEEESERGYPDHYFSFYWDDHGWIHDHLMEYINCDLQELVAFEVPVAVQYFDRVQNLVSNPFHFENKLLKLMDDLCSVINRFHDEKRYC